MGAGALAGAAGAAAEAGGLGAGAVPADAAMGASSTEPGSTARISGDGWIPARPANPAAQPRLAIARANAG
ncbi:Uncharacterised protein [Mycobacteroides abscessus subsp. abscessus]|nr:Uncharacterised protein [Mycobacteroides abscessus subsp. abscessus]